MEDVIVVGAGFAGLRCAYELAQRGCRTTVIEARTRVGGRVWSETLENGATIERGAEFVYAQYEEFRALVPKLGLDLVGTGFDTYDDDLPVELAIAGRDIYEAMSALAQHQADAVANGSDVSMAAVLDGSPVAPHIKPVLRGQIEASVTAVLEDVSARWLPRTASSDPKIGFAEAFRVIGGNQRLATALADHVPVVLATPAVAVRESTDYVEVLTANERAFRARAVVLAVPPELTLRLQLEPQLSPLKVAALKQVGWGAAAKYSAPVDGETPTKPAKDGRLAASMWPASAMPGAVTAFAGTTRALTSLRVADGDAGWRRFLRSVVPPSTQPLRGLGTDWSRDPWTRGSYSYRRVGWTAALEAALSTPHTRRVVVAGDFTSPEPGSMNGALSSGMRAATESLALL